MCPFRVGKEGHAEVSFGAVCLVDLGLLLGGGRVLETACHDYAGVLVVDSRLDEIGGVLFEAASIVPIAVLEGSCRAGR